MSTTDIDPNTPGYLGLGLGHMSDVPVAAFDPVFWLHHWSANPDNLESGARTDTGAAILIAYLQSGRLSTTIGSMIQIRLNQTPNIQSRPIPCLQLLCYLSIMIRIRTAGTLTGPDGGRTWVTSMTPLCLKLVSLRALLNTLLTSEPPSTPSTRPQALSSRA